MNRLDVSTADGTYRVVQEASGRVVVSRHGEPWRDCTGDKLVLALAQSLSAARELREEYRRAVLDARAEIVEANKRIATKLATLT